MGDKVKEYTVKEKYMFEFIEMMKKSNPVEFSLHKTKRLHNGFIEIKFMTLKERADREAREVAEDLYTEGYLYEVIATGWCHRRWYFDVGDIIECEGEDGEDCDSVRFREICGGEISQVMGKEVLKYMVKRFTISSTTI